jgi:8-oxo-dGTP pyrophosphatase MutT (NUDIX family)
MLNTAQIKNRLSGHQPALVSPKGQRHAAVAMLLYQADTGPEVLFIRRNDYEGDPWSGDVAFPGGGLEQQDAGPREAAERETREEIGLLLQPDEYLGRLDDLLGAYLPVTISCFVYRLTERPELKLNAEVVDTFWVPLQELQSPERNQQASFEYRGIIRTHPIIKLDGYCDHFLWGITYRLLQSFFSLFDGQDQANDS